MRVAERLVKSCTTSMRNLPARRLHKCDMKRCLYMQAWKLFGTDSVFLSRVVVLASNAVVAIANSAGVKHAVNPMLGDEQAMT